VHRQKNGLRDASYYGNDSRRISQRRRKYIPRSGKLRVTCFGITGRFLVATELSNFSLLSLQRCAINLIKTNFMLYLHQKLTEFKKFLHSPINLQQGSHHILTLRCTTL